MEPHRREGIPEERIYFVGNVMIDTLVRLLPRTLERWHVTRSTFNLATCQRYILVTLHRPSNVDEPDTLREILLALTEIAQEIPVIFPAHPRTRERISALERSTFNAQRSNVQLTEPLGYLDFLALMRHAALVITDSGGIQEETTYLGIPCLTVRPNTERPITITQGTNRLVRSERGALVDAMRSTLNPSTSLRTGDEPFDFAQDRRRATNDEGRPELWDGHAAERIVNVIRRT